MTDRSLGKLSKYTVRPSPSSGEGVGCWLSHISYRFETTPVHERLLAGYFLPPGVIAENQSRAVVVGIERSIEFLRPRSRVAYLLASEKKDLAGRFTIHEPIGRAPPTRGIIRNAASSVLFARQIQLRPKIPRKIRAMLGAASVAAHTRRGPPFFMFICSGATLDSRIPPTGNK